MARMRAIKPGFFTNDALGTLPMGARLLFLGIWTVSDREGRVLDRPRKLKAELLPYDRVAVGPLLDALSEAGFIQRYVSSAGVALIQVVNWHKHQQPHVKEVASTLPAPDEQGASSILKHPLTIALTGTEALAGAAGGGENDPDRIQGESKLPPRASALAREGEYDSTTSVIFKMYEEEIGTITPAIASALDDWERRLPDDKFVWYAFQQAAENGARSWRYVEKILKRLEDAKWPADFDAINNGRGPKKVGGDQVAWLEQRQQRHADAKAEVGDPCAEASE